MGPEGSMSLQYRMRLRSAVAGARYGEHYRLFHAELAVE